MRLNIYMFLFIFNTGYILAAEHHSCGGTIDILQEEEGYIQYSSPWKYENLTSDNTYYNKVEQPATECVWIINASYNQTVRLTVISIDNNSFLSVHFEISGESRVYATGDSGLISGIGRAIITWRRNKYANSQQFIHLRFTDKTRNSSVEISGMREVSGMDAQTETPSPELSGSIRIWTKSEPALGNGVNTHSIVGRVGGQGSDTVPAFHSSTLAPSLWLSPSTPAVSDKEVPPLRQEASHNNPDTSGAAFTILQITSPPGSLAKGNGQAGDAVVPHKPDLRNQAFESDPKLLLDRSTHSSTYATVTPHFTQGLNPHVQDPVTEVVQIPEGQPISAASADSDLALSRLSATFTAGSSEVAPSTPASETPDQQTIWKYATSHTDPTTGKHQTTSSTVPLSASSIFSGHSSPDEIETHSLLSTADVLTGHALPVFAHLPTAHPITTPAGGQTRNYYVHKNNVPIFLNINPGTDRQDVTELRNDSLTESSIRFSPGGKMPFESEVTSGRESRSITHEKPALSSRPEDTTFRRNEHVLGVTGGVPGTTEWIPANIRPDDLPRPSTTSRRSLSAGESSNAYLPAVMEEVFRLPATTEEASATAVLLDNVTSEETRISMSSAHGGITHLLTASVAPHVSSEDTETHVATPLMNSHSTSTASLHQEITDMSNMTNFTLSVPLCTNRLPDSVNPPLNENLTTQPEFGDTALSNDYHPSIVTGVPSKSESERNSNNIRLKTTNNITILTTTSSLPKPGDREEELSPASYTPHATVGLQGGYTVSEDILRTSSVQSTPEHLLQELTTAGYMLTMSPALNQGTSSSDNHEGRDWTSHKGHAAREAISTDGSLLYTHSLTLPDESKKKILFTTFGISNSATDRHSQEVSSAVSPSRGISLLTSSASGQTSPSVQVTTTIPQKTTKAPVTTSPTVTMTTSFSPDSKTHQNNTVQLLPSTVLPKNTSQASSPQTDQSTTYRGVSTGTTSTQPPITWAFTTPRSSTKPIRGRIFIVEDQPAIVREETFQLLLQIVLETRHKGLEQDAVGKMQSFLQRAPGFQDLQVSWTSENADVMQSVATFSTARALSWLGVPGAILDVTGLREAMRQGLYLSGVKVENITLGGLQSELCSWLFLCPSGFQCMPTNAGNASCTSVCHTDYCKHNGICTHHHGQQPMCQCPVGVDFWFMGQRCDFQMTRQRLVGVCLGVLFSVAVLMVALSFLAIRRFKAMLVQAKVDQTRSSYRRFNHFDELSGRLWLRSWPGSADSLDNHGFSRSDELLHLRALDQTCCYHDDTLSIASTYRGSGTHLNTVYSHSSHYNWDLSNSSINDFMADSGKASDLSVCSWPIEPIQWTPFPLLQQLGVHSSARTSRPRSYCEGMEMVDLEKTWTA